MGSADGGCERGARGGRARRWGGTPVAVVTTVLVWVGACVGGVRGALELSGGTYNENVALTWADSPMTVAGEVTIASRATLSAGYIAEGSDEPAKVVAATGTLPEPKWRQKEI